MKFNLFRIVHGKRSLISLGGALVGLLILVGALTQWSGERPPDTAPASAIAAVPAGSGDGTPSNKTFIAVATASRASVVNISSTRTSAGKGEGFQFPFLDDPFFRRFFGEEFQRRFKPPRERREQGLGSGVIVSPDGYIVTNYHVVEKADEIQVLLSDKRKVKAKLIGTDPKTDIAVIKIDAADLPVLPWGDSSKLQVGEMVMAVGNPFGLNQTVTLGIISAVGRANMGIVDYEDFIQTDAAINPGNSGGALVNLKGELIGINTAIFTRSGGYMGIGFAIPANMVKSVMTSLRKHGKVVRGWLGVSIQEVTAELADQFDAPGTKGALVSDVVETSPAAKAKIKRGDIITAYNGTTVKDPTHLRALVAETIPDTTARVTVLREKRTRTLKVIIGDLPKDLAVASGDSPGSAKGDHALAGVTVENLSPDESRRSGRRLSGVRVTALEPGSPAERAGLRPGDIVREINRKPVETTGDFERLTSRLKPKKLVLVLFSRGNSTIFLTISPG